MYAIRACAQLASSTVRANVRRLCRPLTARAIVAVLLLPPRLVRIVLAGGAGRAARLLCQCLVAPDRAIGARAGALLGSELASSTHSAVRFGRALRRAGKAALGARDAAGRAGRRLVQPCSAMKAVVVVAGLARVGLVSSGRALCALARACGGLIRSHWARRARHLAFGPCELTGGTCAACLRLGCVVDGTCTAGRVAPSRFRARRAQLAAILGLIQGERPRLATKPARFGACAPAAPSPAAVFGARHRIALAAAFQADAYFATACCGAQDGARACARATAARESASRPAGPRGHHAVRGTPHSVAVLRLAPRKQLAFLAAAPRFMDWHTSSGLLAGAARFRARAVAAPRCGLAVQRVWVAAVDPRFVASPEVPHAVDLPGSVR